MTFEWLTPYILDLIEQAEEDLSSGPERHAWVTEKVVAADVWPAFIPKPIRRAVSAWLVELIFQAAVKGVQRLGAEALERIAEDKTPDEGERIVPEKLAASNIEQLLDLRPAAIKKALKTGRFDDRLDEAIAAETEGKARKTVLSHLAERKATIS